MKCARYISSDTLPFLFVTFSQRDKRSFSSVNRNFRNSRIKSNPYVASQPPLSSSESSVKIGSAVPKISPNQQKDREHFCVRRKFIYWIYVFVFRFSLPDRLKKFGQSNSNEYNAKVARYRKWTVQSLYNLTSKFIASLKEHWANFPATIAWIVQQIVHFLKQNSR